ncbi:hypothetical protein C0995_001315 [Termitomyces sp. Mi166|nr:hypothetical protein C0995_001315 [Termitomyces sp. Mi166\
MVTDSASSTIEAGQFGSITKDDEDKDVLSAIAVAPDGHLADIWGHEDSASSRILDRSRLYGRSGRLEVRPSGQNASNLEAGRFGGDADAEGWLGVD